MADEKGGISNTQIMVALIGASAVIGSALIANSDRLFGRSDPGTAQPAPLPGPPSNTAAASNIVASPAPPPAESAPAPAPAPLTMAGAWRGVDGAVWVFQQEGDRAVADRSEGVERVRMEAEVNGQAVRIWVDYFQQATGDMGLRIMNCEGRFADGGQQLQLQCLNPQTNVTTRPTWTRA